MLYGVLRSATEVGDRLQSQNLKENGRHAFEDRCAAEAR